MRVAFYAPLKAPTHSAPSGDRRMARQLMAALRHAGHKVHVASELRSYEGQGDSEKQHAIRHAAQREAELIVERYRAAPVDERPEIWMTYHLYYKAPDWIGPTVCEALDLAYVVAEASHAPKRAGGPWASAHAAVERALRHAQSVIALTRRDMPCLEPVLNADTRLFYLPPFLDHPASDAPEDARPARTSLRTAIAGRHGLDAAKRWLLAVAMMRPGDKLDSYRWLARSLNTLGGEDWQLIIVGDGEARYEVETAFGTPEDAAQHDNIFYTGELAEEPLTAIYNAADVFVWPAINEAYGMALLEAQAAGLPLVAGDSGGVRDVVHDGASGILVGLDDPAEFGNAVRDLLDDPKVRDRIGKSAAEFIRRERSLETATGILDSVLRHARMAHRKTRQSAP